MTSWVWTKLASAKWEDAWIERLAIVPPERLILLQKPGARFLRMEAWLDSRAAAEKLRRAFGGNIKSVATKPNQLAAAVPCDPVRVGRRLMILRDAGDPIPDSMAKAARLVVPANLAFGTGDHATTGMCLRVLEECTRKLPAGWSALDVGCGTGILALAAARLGAANAYGMDFDPVAVRVAKTNAKANRLTKVRFEKADVLKWEPPFRANLVAANLFSGLLQQAMPCLKAAMLPEGQLILSGILREQEPDIRKSLKQNQLKLESARHKGKWVCLLAHRDLQGNGTRITGAATSSR